MYRDGCISRVMTNTTTHWQVIDLHTKQVVATATTAKRARAIRDRKDLEYGAVRYAVRPPTDR